jgi:hypothetical protein
MTVGGSHMPIQNCDAKANDKTFSQTGFKMTRSRVWAPDLLLMVEGVVGTE